MRYYRGWWWVKVRGLWVGFRHLETAVRYHESLRRVA